VKTLRRVGLVIAVPFVVAAGAYDLASISGEYSAGGRSFVRIVSGPAGGSWYPVAAKLSQVFAADIPEILTSAGPGGGIENVRDINQHNAEVGFSLSDAVFNGFRGLDKFKHPQSNIRHMATAYPVVFQVAVPRDSPIRSIADLRDKNISPGRGGTSTLSASRAALNAYSITLESIRQNGGTVHHVEYADSVALMKDKHIDAFLVLTSIRQSSLMELDFDPGIRLLNVDERNLEQILGEVPGSIRFTIPKGTYSGMEDDVQTFGIQFVVLVNKDVPDDLVYRLTKSFWAHRDDMVDVTSAWKTVTIDNALLSVMAPVHPGAQRYYDEMEVKPR